MIKAYDSVGLFKRGGTMKVYIIDTFNFDHRFVFSSMKRAKAFIEWNSLNVVDTIKHFRDCTIKQEFVL